MQFATVARIPRLHCTATYCSELGLDVVARTVGLRKDSGAWVRDPQDLYDRISSVLSSRQVGIEQLYWLEDESLPLDSCLYTHSRSKLLDLLRLQQERKRVTTKGRPYAKTFETLGRTFCVMTVGGHYKSPL